MDYQSDKLIAISPALSRVLTPFESMVADEIRYRLFIRDGKVEDGVVWFSLKATELSKEGTRIQRLTTHETRKAVKGLTEKGFLFAQRKDEKKTIWQSMNTVNIFLAETMGEKYLECLIPFEDDKAVGMVADLSLLEPVNDVMGHKLTQFCNPTMYNLDNLKDEDPKILKDFISILYSGNAFDNLEECRKSCEGGTIPQTPTDIHGVLVQDKKLDKEVCLYHEVFGYPEKEEADTTEEKPEETAKLEPPKPLGVVKDETLESAGLEMKEDKDGVTEVVVKEEPKALSITEGPPDKTIKKVDFMADDKPAEEKKKEEPAPIEEKKEEETPLPPPEPASEISKDEALQDYVTYCKYMKAGSLLKKDVLQWDSKDFVIYFYCAIAKIKQKNLTLPSWGKDGMTFSRLLQRYNPSHLKQIIYTFAKYFDAINDLHQASLTPDMSVLTADWKVSCIEKFMQEGEGLSTPQAPAPAPQVEQKTEEVANTVTGTQPAPVTNDMVEQYRTKVGATQ